MAVELQEAQQNNCVQEDLNRNKKKDHERTNILPYHKLFSFADSTDYLLMLMGTIGAAGNGVCLPLMTLVFGDVVNAFGDNSVNINVVVHQVSKVFLFIYSELQFEVVSVFLRHDLLELNH